VRIIHVTHRYPPATGGAEAVFARLTRFHVRAGDSVSVHTTTALDLHAFWDRTGRQVRPGRSIEDGAVVHRHALFHVPLIHRPLLKVLSLIPVARWQALCVPWNPIAPGMWNAARYEREKPDIVHATAFPYSWPLACARRMARRWGAAFFLTPFVHTGDADDAHDRTRSVYTSPALLQIARSADRIFVQTKGERQALLARGLPAERLVLQGLGVDLETCTGGDRRRARAAWGAADEMVVGHLANNSRAKGTIDLVEAARLLWSAGERFVLVVAGPSLPEFDGYVRRLPPGLPLRVLGRLDDGAKRDFFAGLDLFALPSRSDSFGLVIPEAWASGIPSVVYRAGGLPWVVRDGTDGLVVKCGDVPALAAALRRLIRDGAARRQLGEAGRARLGEFDWERSLGLVRRVAEQVVEERLRLSG